ncbi:MULTISPECIES: hypothetical protein [Luteimonas]|uniref:hypothetical protein n=1 Tax=Luteimonas TaxID=83614 RepID=UPI0011CD4C72|nr:MULTISPECIES: hypothetical protein [Luteimonas]
MRILRTACVVLSFAAVPAFAQAPLSDAQATYMGAHVFDRQLEVFREFCAQDRAGAQALDTAVMQFRLNNPDYVAAKESKPQSADFDATVKAVDAQFDRMAGTMRTQLAAQPVGAQCASLGDQLRQARFASMLEQAKRGPPATP